MNLVRADYEAELSAGELQQIQDAVAKIDIQGERYSAQMQKLVGR